ncbi:MAG: hypothetical protein KKI15_20130 [Proteobacteria bacterium]|nr:hypothetical protein [Pseudomonadota bacterium]
MRKLINVGCGILVLFFLAGCGANVQEVIDGTKLVWVGDNALQPDPKAEAILLEAFSQSDIAWDKQQMAEATGARDAIQSQFAFLREKLKLDGTLSYYTFKSSFEFIQYNYNVLEGILDERIASGALDEKSGVIYGYVKRDINVKLDIQRAKIAEAEADINGRVTELSIEQMKGVYDTLRLLIAAAL